MRPLFACCLVLLLTACQEAPKDAVYHRPNFAAAPKIALNVASVEVINHYKPTLAAPNVEHLFPVKPWDAVKGWTEDRIVASGKEGKLEVIIDDAAVTSSALPRTQGVKGAFTNDQAEKFTGKLEVTLKLYTGEDVMSAAEVHGEVSQSNTLAENASPAQREKLFHRMLEQMMQNLDKELDRNIHNYFGSHFAQP